MNLSYYPDLLSTTLKCIEACSYNTIVEANAKMLLAFRKVGIYISNHDGPSGTEITLDPVRIGRLCDAYPLAKRFSDQELNNMALFARYYPKMVLHKFAEACRQNTTPGDVWMKDPNCRDKWQRQRRDFQTLFYESIVAQVPWSHHKVLLTQQAITGDELFCAMLSFIKERTPINLFQQQVNERTFQNDRKYVFENGTSTKCHSYVSDSSMYSEILHFINPEADDPDVKAKYLDKLWKTILRSSNDFGFNGTNFSLGNDKFVDIALLNLKKNAHVFIDVEIDGCRRGNGRPSVDPFEMYDKWMPGTNMPVYYVIGVGDPAWQAELALQGINYFNLILSQVISKDDVDAPARFADKLVANDIANKI